MKTFKQIKTIAVNGLLLVGLAGLLLAYLAVVSDLPSRVYTAAQQEFLGYNYRRSISQLAPTWQIVQSDGHVASTIFPGQESRVRATLAARYEEQGSVSVTVYDLDFHGEYRLVQSGPMSMAVQLFFPFPGNLETLHEVHFLVDDQEPPGAQYTTQGISWQAVLEADQEHQIAVSYKADGANSFSYGLHHNQRSDVEVTVTVLGLSGSKVPKTSLPASDSESTDDGEIWTWDYASLIADRDIQLTLPARLSFAQRVAQLQDDFRALAGLAPFLVGLFLASLAGVLHLSGAGLRLEGYLLTGCGLALFYPLLTFLSGVVDLIPAAALAMLLVSGLLVAFLSLTVGGQWIRWRAGVLLITFLGFFSLGLLTPWRGLLLTSGGLLLVGTFMLLYARRPAAPETETTPPPAEVESEQEPTPPPAEVAPPQESAPPQEATAELASLHCPYCARALADDYGFCPGCGHDTSHLLRCADCGHQQFVPTELKPVHCIHCGQLLS